MENRPSPGDTPAMDIQTPPLWLTGSLARSEAQIEAGRPVPFDTVPFDTVLGRLRPSIAWMTAK